MARTPRMRRLPPHWEELRAGVLERDRHACQFLDGGLPCGALARDVDHIQPGDDHRPQNLQALCDYHHRWKTSHEAGQASIPTHRRRQRPTPPHPGVVDP